LADTVIRVEDLHKHFGNVAVLNGIHLEVNRGEVVVIIGPSKPSCSNPHCNPVASVLNKPQAAR